MPNDTHCTRRFFNRTLPLVALAMLLASGRSRGDVITYEDDVLPVFRDHCLSCHNSEKKRADIDLSVYSQIIAAEIVSPGDPSESLLYQVVSHAEKPFMPPEQPQIPGDAVAKIRGWIQGGLVERSGSKALIKKSSAVVGLSQVPSGRPPGPPCVPTDALLEPAVALERGSTISALACAPWAPLMAVGARGQVLIYSSASLELVAVLPFPEGTPAVVRFSRSGTLLLAGGGRAGHSGRVVVWDVQSCRRVCEVGEELDAVMAADISPDHSEIALGGASKLINIYSTTTGEKIESLRKHAEWITGVEYSPDGVLIATSDRGGGLFIWESFSRQLFHDLRGHGSGIVDVSWRSDANVLATGGRDGQAFLWSMESGNNIKKWRAHGPGVTAIAYGRDGRLITAGRDRVVKTWHGDGKGIRGFTGLDDIATAARMDESGTRVVGGDWAGRLIVWNDKDATPLGEISSSPPTIAQRASLADQSLAAAEIDRATTETERQRAARSERAARVELEGATRIRDAAGASRAAAVAREGKAQAFVKSIEAAIAAAESIGSDGLDLASLLETQRGLLAPARQLAKNAAGEVAAAQEMFAEAEASLPKLSDRHQALSEDLEVRAAAAEQAQERVADCERRVAYWQAAALNVRRWRARETLEHVEGQFAAVSAEREALVTQLGAKEMQRNVTEARLVALPRDRAEHQDQIARAVARFKAANEETGVLRDGLSKGEEIVGAATVLLTDLQQRAEADPQSEALVAAVTHARSLVEALSRDRERAQSDLDAHLQHVAAEDSACATLTSALAEFELNAEKVPLEAQRLAAEIAAIQARLEKKTAEVVSVEARVGEALRGYQGADVAYRDALAKSR